MSWEEFELMPNPFGWKVEYWDGNAHLTPREFLVSVGLRLEPRKVIEASDLERIGPSDAEKLTDAFFHTFRDSVEFFNWPVSSVRNHAEKNIRDYFNSVRGKPLPISSKAIGSEGELIGTALFVEKKDGKTELDLLFVDRRHHRRGVASQLVGTAVNALINRNVHELRSAFHVCNEGSRGWHIKFGFEVIPDQTYIRMKYAWYSDEIWRLSKIGATDKLPEMEREKDRWYAQLDDLWKD